MDAILIILGAIFCLMLISALFKFGASLMKGLWSLIKLICKGIYWLFSKIINNRTIPKR